MKKIAFISDIHSNIEALSTVVREIWSGGIEEIYCLGDIVGYNTFPNEVCDYLRSREIICIKGNHDNDVVNKKFNEDKDPDIFRWTYDTLTEENRNWLANLPEQIEIDAESQKILLVHGTPTSIEEYCYAGSENSARAMRELTQDLLICGHTHQPSITYYGAKALMNCGSVGKPKHGKPTATWLEISFFNALMNPRLKEVVYDFEKTAQDVEAKGFIKYAQQLRTGVVA